jgi:adenine deaminase
MGEEVLLSESSNHCALPSSFRCSLPSADAIRIDGSGKARVIGLIPHQISTESLLFDIRSQDIPDFNRDILKLVVCNRYTDKKTGVGLVHGFALKNGAIASSVAHDAHNIIAVGTSDTDILNAIDAVISSKGGIAAVVGNSKTILPLECGGLMSTLPYSGVALRLRNIHDITREMGSIDNPFMYLSFLALTVIPALRITDRGLFDAVKSEDVPLFVK